jgi:ABC-type sugar transport system permease subunit
MYLNGLLVMPCSSLVWYWVYSTFAGLISALLLSEMGSKDMSWFQVSRGQILMSINTEVVTVFSTTMFPLLE